MADYKRVEVIYGFLPRKISRRQAEIFVRTHAAEQGLETPAPPVADYWCREAPAHLRADAEREAGEGFRARWMVGWTCPVIERDPSPPLVALS